MTNKSIQSVLDEIRLVSERNHEIVEAVRVLVRMKFEAISEEVKYGGILFTAGVQFGGVFAYKAHVTVEFGSGARIVDPFGFLDGSGKNRRHIKLFSFDEIKKKKLAEYFSLALQAAEKEVS